MLLSLVFVSLAFCSVDSSTVPAPTNVSLTCHNFTNVLYWNYSKPELQPEFNIKIRGYMSKPKSVRTTQTYLDISEYTQDSEDAYYITVEAQLRGTELNASSEDITFSYRKDLPSMIPCVVDFPALNISVFPQAIKLSFLHPFDVYQVDSLEDAFSYTVFGDLQSEKLNYCDSGEGPCTGELYLVESLNGSCINISIKGDVNGISTETSRIVCGVAPNEMDWTVILTIVMCSMVGLLFLIIIGVKIFKKLIQPDSQSTIFSKLLGMVNSDRIINEPEQPHLSVVASLGHTPLLETSDPAFLDTFSPTVTEESLFPTHLPIHSSTDGKVLDEEDTGEMEDSDSGGFNSGNSFSGYDSQKFPVDMGQGDMVDAYGPRQH
ncbi:interferon gamma receptor 1-like [Neoarius graeffei]|uniref:interferon gamma receptor 1-like n=1 Tax=Neoarius graeffei TaxID=443677 RepID=UPI00298D5058|nr:interferon gamma receptor 1-like [Neoarius graeffei]